MNKLILLTYHFLSDIIFLDLVSPECLTEMVEVRRSLMEDYQLTPGIVSQCGDEINNYCGQVPIKYRPSIYIYAPPSHNPHHWHQGALYGNVCI